MCTFGLKYLIKPYFFKRIQMKTQVIFTKVFPTKLCGNNLIPVREEISQRKEIRKNTPILNRMLQQSLQNQSTFNDGEFIYNLQFKTNSQNKKIFLPKIGCYGSNVRCCQKLLGPTKKPLPKKKKKISVVRSVCQTLGNGFGQKLFNRTSCKVTYVLVKVKGLNFGKKV